uniref:Uncharacterized protein n=1 Tax=Aegilops tauschii subsp. strangulata TaxID=200361 RepID=A0A453M2P8_AEGTS
MATPQHRPTSINWDQLHMPSVQGSGLDNPFTEEEVWAAIKESLAEKTPRPDGFSGVFFRSCWSIIKEDIMQAFQKFYHLAGQNF